MKYEWENDIDNEKLQMALYDLLDGQPQNIIVAGVVLVDLESMEGAFIRSDEFKETGIAAADVFQDAIYDLDGQRIVAVRKALGINANG
jgi:hypothetical protein